MTDIIKSFINRGKKQRADEMEALERSARALHLRVQQMVIKATDIQGQHYAA